jgi:hypothetical protein
MATYAGNTPWKVWAGIQNVGIQCYVTKDSGINVDLRYYMGVPGGGSYFDWTMYLQQYYRGAWRTIASRSGYITETSPSSRTFTNIGGYKRKTRIKVKFRGGGKTQWRDSRTFVR